MLFSHLCIPKPTDFGPFLRRRALLVRGDPLLLVQYFVPDPKVQALGSHKALLLSYIMPCCSHIVNRSSYLARALIVQTLKDVCHWWPPNPPVVGTESRPMQSWLPMPVILALMNVCLMQICVTCNLVFWQHVVHVRTRDAGLAMSMHAPTVVLVFECDTYAHVLHRYEPRVCT